MKRDLILKIGSNGRVVPAANGEKYFSMPLRHIPKNAFLEKYIKKRNSKLNEITFYPRDSILNKFIN